MEKIIYMKKYRTDINGSWGIGHITVDINMSFKEVLEKAIEKKAFVIVKPSRGKYWYVKGINGNKTFEEIKEHIENNLKNDYRNKSQCWLINYEE